MRAPGLSKIIASGEISSFCLSGESLDGGLIGDALKEEDDGKVKGILR